MRVIYTTFFILTIALIAGIAGCPEPESKTTTREERGAFQRKERGEALVDAAVRQLADLPAAVDMELRPPTVILDASQSGGQDVLAVCVPNPNVPDGPVNIISVQSGNGRFRSLRVQPGDMLKYYILEDETVDEQRRAEGLARQLAKELQVAQVLDDNTLIIEGSLDEPVPVQAKLEVWRYSDERLLEINEKLVLYRDRRLPDLGWEPSPDAQALTQLVTWLNQWLRQSEPKTEWKRDPLLDSLDPELLSDKQLAPFVSNASLSAAEFNPYEKLQPKNEDTMADSLYDARLLQEAVWLRDISRWAQGNNFNDLARATALFDWTVMNVQLDADENATPHRPWQTLLYSRGTADERAWVFAQLARQQGLDVVMLKISSAEGGEDRAEGQNSNVGPPPSPLSPQPYWLPAVLLDRQLYLFDPRLGLPIPGPGGEGVATLEQARSDDAILRQLDLEGTPYPLTAEAFKNAEAYIVADAFDLTRRARQLESKLVGQDNLVLATTPSNLAEQLKNVPGLSGVKLWDVPFRTLRDQLTLGKTARQREALAFEPFAHRPGLWKARTRHFQGRRHEARQARDEAIDDHREAVQLYTSKTVRPTDREIARTASSEKRRVDSSTKLYATYWTGLLSYDGGKFDVAVDWLGRPELVAESSPLSAGARYNLARAHEAKSNYEEAAKLLDADTSPQQHGNRIRAKRLRALAESANENRGE